eukprot:CAMPEP_0197065158 /NCGR_PEP_ID=MMETSP1384-20130603/164865_1 /TAXON_ID=29189 /ORGANISM="Ammonia sp." /LENGTH=195 /DNA_ID=CAMNT_0042501895 /DNA_START=1 /DNA_END=584 /DNA_ORIENTATION=-
MSSYLNSFVVGDYQRIEGVNPYFLPQVFPHHLYYPWNRPVTDARYAYNISLFAVYYYGSEDMFNYSFTRMLPKLDEIGNEGRPFAMEHWGLVTYGAPKIMVDESTASLKEKIDCAAVLAHEIAHQWHGNLVTCKWWSDIFVNEGFAEFWESITIDQIRPELHILDTQVTMTNDIMIKDVSKYTRPVILHEDEVQT